MVLYWRLFILLVYHSHNDRSSAQLFVTARCLIRCVTLTCFGLLFFGSILFSRVCCFTHWESYLVYRYLVGVCTHTLVSFHAFPSYNPLVQKKYSRFYPISGISYRIVGVAFRRVEPCVFIERNWTGCSYGFFSLFVKPPGRLVL